MSPPFELAKAIARCILPPSILTRVRRTIHKADARYHLGDVVEVNISGINACFKIQSPTCVERIIEGIGEKPFRDGLLETIKQIDNPVFADIGAAQGGYSIPAAIAGAHVYAFDPDPVSQTLFETNLRLNPEAESKTSFFNLALGDTEGTTKLHFDRRAEYAPSLEKTTRTLTDVIEVKMNTLDNLIDAVIIHPPHVTKIDVEGAEQLVLNGMERLLNSRNKPQHMFIELHPKYLKQFGGDLAGTVSFIREHGYRDVKVWERRSQLLCHFVTEG